MRPGHDDVYMAMCEILSYRSTCHRRSVGCIIVDHDFKVLSTGYNGVAAGEVHCTTVKCKGSDYPSGEALDKCEAIHAETNALMQCNDVTKIFTIYVTTHPCSHCCKMIANTSCERVVYFDEYPRATRIGPVEYIKYER